jgi:uncharacterized GH25 family protein
VGNNEVYSVRYNADNAIIDYKLDLNSDGTFTFHSYTNHFKATPAEKNEFGKGTWKAKKNSIIFEINSNTDLNEKYTLNLQNTKARIDRKSPRNKTAEIIPTTMRIYESEISWVKGLKLTKVGR